MSLIVNYNGPKTQNDLQLMTQQNQRSAAYDPVDKLRTSSPQALIDTDFEYGTQPTKWETIALQQGRPSVYYIAQSPRVPDISASNKGIQGAGTTTVTVFMADTTGFSVGTPIYIQNSADVNANGWWLVSAVSSNVSVSYVTTNVVASGNQFNPANTYIYLGYFYSGSGINLASGTTAFVTSTNTVTVTTVGAHGLSKGSLIYVVGTTGGTNVNGAWVVATVPTASTFTYASTGATGTVTNAAGQTNLYARPSGYVEPRAFDGGVAFSAGAAVPNQQLIRQTRRYFRYQSGKGIQFSTGTTLKPSIFNTSLTSSGLTVGSTITVTTRFPHNLATGCVVSVVGVDQAGYNGTFTITSTGTLTFTYVATVAPTATTATGNIIKISPLSWYGSSNRVGFFDQQNGMFFEFDGQTLYAVWRTSTNQINGTVAVTQGSGTITGTGTQFTSQLAPNDYIVIRGQSYKVVSIASDTSLFISPEYRGATLNTTNNPNSGYIVSKTIDTRYPQSTWFDPCDGTGPSGYTLDLTKMQMWYIDYSWYGAGVIRWGFRTTGGAIIYAFAQTNNNQRYEAYMRSGNMSAHYESNGQTPVTYLTSTLSSIETGTINVASTAGFAPSGTVKVSNAGSSGTIEYIAYSGKTSTTLTGLTRIQTGGNGTAQTFTAANPSTNAIPPVAVELASPDTAASLSHWGSSVIMDGRFDDDKSLVFNYGMTTAMTTTATTPVPILAIRIAPSVDNGTTGTLGLKEIINRMQLQLTELQLFTTGTTGYLINLILNGYVTGTFSGNSGNFVTPISAQSPTSSSLAQVNFNTTNTVTISAGESVAATFTAVSGPTTIDLSQVRDLGNSILGGGTSNTVPTAQAGLYPDGPDILYVVAIPLSATSATIQARLSWKEAQA
jgi:hypothetical protein